MDPDHTHVRSFSKYWFLQYADELYALTRFAYFAFLQNVAFGNAHRAVEYYLKAGLADSTSLEELKGIGHDLTKLHGRFCELVAPSEVSQEDIDYLDHFDELRYPRDDSFTHTCWALPFEQFFDRFEPELRNRVACFSMPDIDRIVHDLRSLVVASDPWKIIVVTQEQATFLYRENRYFEEGTAAEEEMEQPTDRLT